MECKRNKIIHIHWIHLLFPNSEITKCPQRRFILVRELFVQRFQPGVTFSYPHPSPSLCFDPIPIPDTVTIGARRKRCVNKIISLGLGWFETRKRWCGSGFQRSALDGRWRGERKGTGFGGWCGWVWWKQVGMLQDFLRRNGKPSLFEDVFGDSTRENRRMKPWLDSLIISFHVFYSTIGFMAVACCFRLSPWLQCVTLGPHGVFLHEMSNRVQPLVIPAENATPHLKSLIWFDFPLEITAHPAKHKWHRAPELLPRPLHSATDEIDEKIQTGNVKILEVSAVGFMKIIVTI